MVGREVGRPKQRPRRVLCDQAFEVDRIRAWCRARSIGAVIPPKKKNWKRRRGRPLAYDRALYRERNVLERMIGHMKEHRRIVTWHEMLAVRYRAMVQLAFVERYLRILESPDRAWDSSSRKHTIEQGQCSETPVISDTLARERLAPAGERFFGAGERLFPLPILPRL